jgi:glycerol-1-phosphate dehydrogenase [NAD(P)+]
MSSIYIPFITTIWGERIKHIRLPRNVIVGRNVLPNVREVAKNYSDVLTVTGPKTAMVAGYRVSEALESEVAIVEKSDEKEVYKLRDRIKIDGNNLAVAVGGGKVMDVTKLAAMEAGIDYVTVPTNCSNDGLASPVASLEFYTNGYAKSGTTSVMADPPVAVIADIDIISKSPYKFVAAGVGETIAKYSAVRDWKLGQTVKGEYYGDYSSALSLMVADVVMNSTSEIKKRTEYGMSVLIEALVSSGAAMGITGSSRPASGSEHKFSHAIDRITSKKGALHGEQCGVGTILMSYLQGEDWQKVRNALRTAECPTTMKELGLDRDVGLEAMLKAREIRPERYTIIEHLKINRDMALKALEATEVI